MGSACSSGELDEMSAAAGLREASPQPVSGGCRDSEAAASASSTPERGRDPVALGTEHDVVHRGPVWKLVAESGSEKSERWVQRSMWLTAGGGLFHDGLGPDGKSEPCGCLVGGLRVKPLEQRAEDRFAFELRPPGVGQSAAGAAMVLAVDSEEEREAWLRGLAAFEGSAGCRNALSPLDIYASKGPTRRRSRTELELLGLDGEVPATAAVSSSAPAPSGSDAGDGDRDGLSDADSEDAEEPGLSLRIRVERLRDQHHRVRRNSQSFYAEKLHTSLLLDWDDTIFPTTWVRRDCALNWRRSLESQLQPGPRMTLINTLLERHLERAADFFSEAAQHANIFIVTLARRPWVEMSMQNFLPKLAGVLNTMDLKVIYAQEYVDEHMALQYSHDEFKSSEESKRFWTLVKSEAIARELEEFHRRNDTSWKNILSLGDSDYERYGTISAGEDYMRREMKGSKVLRTGVTPDGNTHTCEGVSKDGHLKRLRMKTVKLLSEPTIEELTAELNLLKNWLPHMVQKDGGFDIELDCSDDNERLRDLHRQVTGEYEELTWEELAGMT